MSIILLIIISEAAYTFYRSRNSAKRHGKDILKKTTKRRHEGVIRVSWKCYGVLQKIVIANLIDLDYA